jgi:hypothetical protein
MRKIALIELSANVGDGHVVVPSRIVQNHPNGIDGVSVQVKSCQQYIEKLLRVAASSNQSLERKGCKSVTARNLNKINPTACAQSRVLIKPR